MNPIASTSSNKSSPSMPTDTKDLSIPETRTVFQKSDFMFLRDFHHIVDMILSGSHQEEIGKAVAQLDERFENARRILEDLPGLQYVKEEQEAILERELVVLNNQRLKK